MLRVIGFKIRRIGQIPDDGLFFIVGNHLSYIDPVIMFASFPAIFITSKEIGEDLLLGTICRLGECYFVERRNKFNIKQEIDDVGSYLRNGFNVAIFPEGRATDGDRVWRFKTSFFQVPVNEKVKVLPVCLQYVSFDGEKITPENRDRVFWYDGRPFMAHLCKMLSLKEIVVEVKVLSSIEVGSNDKNSLSEIAREQIASTYVPVSVNRAESSRLHS